MAISRRAFLGNSALVGAGAMFGGAATDALAVKAKDDGMIWAALLHLGINSWSDGPLPNWGSRKKGDPDDFSVYLREAQPYMRTTDEEWRFCVDGMAKAGMNMIVIDMAEGIQYESHPELAVKGSWSIEKFRKELDRMRAMGLEPIPKMNFSASHDTWLKDYHRMVSTKRYYEVCANLIREVYDIFDKPRFFHLGYDEETAQHQSLYQYAVVRQGELWWHDFLWFNKTVEALGTRTWIWADKIWHHREEFEKRMPRSVLMSNWYYGAEFDIAKIKNENIKKYVGAYAWLEKAGFDQIPAGSNNGFRTNTRNFQKTVEHCVPRIAPERLKGFCMASWSRQVPKYHEQNADSFVESAEAKAIYNRIKAG
ncbi:MAG: Tat pathway signal protein [Kiritimatiellae bacterium]|nr:Tat pathway signal protein [Kiritimatiellia bacterium]